MGWIFRPISFWTLKWCPTGVSWAEVGMAAVRADESRTNSDLLGCLLSPAGSITSEPRSCMPRWVNVHSKGQQHALRITSVPYKVKPLKLRIGGLGVHLRFLTNGKFKRHPEETMVMDETCENSLYQAESMAAPTTAANCKTLMWTTMLTRPWCQWCKIRWR